MSLWTAVMIIAVVGIIFGNRRHHRFDRFGRHPQQPEEPQLLARNSELEREISELRERVKVLERIATDAEGVGARDARAIAAEIEALRNR